MTSVLFWNINNFSEAKIEDPKNPFHAQHRCNHIAEEVFIRNTPHIFVVVEVHQRQVQGAEGSLVGGHGKSGVLRLLDELRDVTDNRYWSLVPPVKLGGGDLGTGVREAVAVFYDAQFLKFTGPFLWAQTPEVGFPCGMPIQAAYVGHNIAYNQFREYNHDGSQVLNTNNIDYPVNTIAAFNNNIRQVRHTVNGNPVDIPENQHAGQWYFLDENDFYLNFPNEDSRSPFLTRFKEVGGHERTINLYSIHTSPSSAKKAVRNLARIPAIANPTPAATVDVIVGDFNVDSFNPSKGYKSFRTYYDTLLNVANPFRMALNPLYNNAINNDRRPFCMTHLLGTNEARPYNANGVAADPQHNVYPRFGYMGSKGGDNFQDVVHTGSIDNVFYRHGANSYPPVPNNISVVNTVVGKPYNQSMPGAAVTVELRGGMTYESSLINGIPIPQGVNPELNNNRPRLKKFRKWDNYDRIYNTSDHLALYIEI